MPLMDTKVHCSQPQAPGLAGNGDAPGAAPLEESAERGVMSDESGKAEVGRSGRIGRVGRWARRPLDAILDRVMLWAIRRSGVAAKFVEVQNADAVMVAGLIRLTERVNGIDLHLGRVKRGQVKVAQKLIRGPG